MVHTKSYKIKDKRIDKLIEKQGFNISDCEIFYSPIKGSFIWFGLFMLILFPYCFYFFALPIYGIAYIIVTYLFFAYFNNSFALTKEQLIVINPNFPFQKVRKFDLSEIKKIKIDRSLMNKITWIFAIINCNYIEIINEDKKFRFYCESLELTDDYNENVNFTEKTLDDFNYALKQHNVLTELIL